MSDIAGERVVLGDFNRHFWQLRSVAKLAGIDLGEAMREGRLSALEYAEIVTRCRGAKCVLPCAQWLAQSGEETNGKIPEYCANKNSLESLRHKH